MLYNYFGKNQVLRSTFGEIWRIQIQMYPQSSFEPKYGAFNLKKKSQCPWIRVSSPTELKSSSPFGFIGDIVILAVTDLINGINSEFIFPDPMNKCNAISIFFLKDKNNNLIPRRYFQVFGIEIF